jgi:flavin-dependent dehydrogenase
VIKINVAVMGAGLSGLTCAIIMEKHGLKPTIYENRSEAGDRFVNCEIMLSALTKPIDDTIKFLAEEYEIYLQPQHNIQKLILYSEKEKAEIEGQLGFTNMRGRHDNSFEKQLARQVNSKIIYNSNLTYEELTSKHSHVILATGDAAYASKIQDYRKDLTVTLKGAIIKGKFDPYTVYAWLNNKLAPKGYGYLIPISHTKANIVIGFPEYPETIKFDINKLWANFAKDVSQKLNQKITITDHFEVNNYIIGVCEKPRIGNTFFVGNNFGSIMPFLGFGQFAAIMSGVFAGYDLCGKGDYIKLTKTLRESYQESLVLRNTLEKMDNHKYDFLIKNLNYSFTKQVFTGKRNYLKAISKILDFFV